ncbi:MAG: tyrosine-type recombinase/integrase [Burkholderiaceae bacterium]|nr:tyrosine-type recombinase/integrase [Burkholderiaceae bacterium]
MKSTTIFVKRLGRHHFAHLRCVAEGIDTMASALRYLGIEHGHQAITAHRQVISAVRAVTRRHVKDSHWRLIGLAIPVPSQTDRPSLDVYAEENGLEDWSESDILQMYQEAYPPDQKATRRARTLKRLLDLLAKVEVMQVQDPSPSDMVSDWFDDVTAKRLINAGIINLGELHSRIRAGGRWYRALPTVGPTKAKHIADHLTMLLQIEPEQRATFSLATGAGPSVLTLQGPAGSTVAPSSHLLATLTQVPSSVPIMNLGRQAIVRASTDEEAAQAWIEARAGSAATVKVYERSVRRLLLWLKYEKQSIRFADMTVNDCGDFMAFLRNVPDRWISRQRAAPGEPGWAPFRGQLDTASYKQLLGHITGLFGWLQTAQYIPANPWAIVNQKIGDDPDKRLLDTKAFSESAVLEIRRFIENQDPSPARDRMLFIVKFMEAVGLRSAELLNARLKDFQLEPEGWFMQVHGKGSKNRLAAIPPPAMRALQDYLQSRGLVGIEEASPQAPVLASTKDPMAPVGYQALYETVKSWFARAVRASALPAKERERLSGATTHWLRHTFGTRAIARDVPADVVQAQMGHASIQTTTAIYGRAPAKRRADHLNRAFFE